MTPPTGLARLRSAAGLFQNLSIQIKASAASIVLLVCLLALGAGYRLFVHKDFAPEVDYVALGQFVGLIAALSLMARLTL